MNQKPKTCPTSSMLTYSLGECANSLVMNLLLRTCLTMFFIPYMALGFEMFTDYQRRSFLGSFTTTS